MLIITFLQQAYPKCSAKWQLHLPLVTYRNMQSINLSVNIETTVVNVYSGAPDLRGLSQSKRSDWPDSLSLRRGEFITGGHFIGRNPPLALGRQ